MKLKSIWMHAWDLEGVEPQALIAELQECGLNACNLAFSYHGGRMLLPRHRSRRVYEQDLSAVYFQADAARYRGLRLQPQVAPQAVLIEPFLRAAQAAQFEVNAWTVLCHNDRLGALAPECTIENVYGEHYTYALCPSNLEVRDYVRRLCGDIARVEGVAQLDLEALNFMSYEHASLHDKHGLPLTAAVKWLLSLCVCVACRRRFGDALDEVAAQARDFLKHYFAEFPDTPATADLQVELIGALGESPLGALLEQRATVLMTLLDEVRSETGTTPLNVRAATSPLFVGSKTALTHAQLVGRADSATVTFLGASREQMRADLARLPMPEQRRMPVYGGFCFHHPDCADESDVRSRLALLHEARLDGAIVYCYGMAGDRHFRWLKQALGGGPRLL